MKRSIFYFKILFRCFVLPCLVIPVLIIVANKISSETAEDLENVSYKVGWVDKNMGQELYDLIDLNLFFQVQKYADMALAEEGLARQEVDLYIELEDNFDSLLVDKTASCTIISNKEGAFSYLEPSLNLYKQQQQNRRYEALGIRAEQAEPFEYSYIDNSFSIVGTLDNINTRIYQVMAGLWYVWWLWISLYLLFLLGEYKKREVSIKEYLYLAFFTSVAEVFVCVVTYWSILGLGNETVDRLILLLQPFMNISNLGMIGLYFFASSLFFYAVGTQFLRIPSWRTLIGYSGWFFMVILGMGIWSMMNEWSYTPLFSVPSVIENRLSASPEGRYMLLANICTSILLAMPFLLYWRSRLTFRNDNRNIDS